MNFKRFFSAAVALLMVLALVPVAALAAGAEKTEAQKLAMLDEVWAAIEAAEAEAMTNGAKPAEVTITAYNAALQNKLVDKGSLAELDDNGFCFKVDGMNCVYDYRCRNTAYESVVNETTPRYAAEALVANAGTRTGPTNMNVLLIAPYYGYDSSFTDQYEQEAQSIADTTAGEYTLLEGHAATGPAIVEAFPDSGVVIYDSHGTQSGNSSYLCLTTNAGITSEDYANGWAVSSGSAAYIDGRYIQNHITNDLPGTLIWMAICEGMHANGNGTHGRALLEAGAGCVYGYSQSVTFVGDYAYEETFWTEMKNGATVAEAFEVMVDTHGECDPYGDAYPIVMSPLDDFPSNPDAPQTVYCDWSLFGGNAEPVDLVSFFLSPENLEVYEGFDNTIEFNREPYNANNYTLVWESADTSVATVEGNNRRAIVTGVSEGQTTITCTVMVGEEVMGTDSVMVDVLYFPSLSEAANIEGGTLEFTSTGSYPWTAAIVDGMAVAKSGNGGASSSSSTMSITLNLSAGDVFEFDWKVSSEANYDKLGFYVNNTLQGSQISGNVDWQHITYTVPSDGTYVFAWTYTKDGSVNTSDDCGYVDNVCVTTSTLIGDVDGNGTVDMADALLVMRYVLDINTLTDEQLAVADFNGDGVINTTDVLLIMRAATSD